MAAREYLRRLMEAGAVLERDEARLLMELVLAGGVSEVEVAAIVGAMAARGETAAEIAGFAEAMRGAATTLPLTAGEQEALVDTCGTGGDASGTFNISTAAALVAAAAGARVAKHGNRKVTSACGSADVLEAMGIPVDLDPQNAAEALRSNGFVFLHAPSHHPAMRAVMPVRRALGVRTVFNVLGPLTNPAGARRQVMGVYARRLLPLVGEAMAMLGARHALVVHGETGDGGMDEMSVSGVSYVAEVRDGTVREYEVTPEEVGLERTSMTELVGGDAVGNAAILQAVFAGETGPRRDVVLLNAAAVLLTAGMAGDLPEGIRLAARTIDSGAVVRLLDRLRVPLD